MRSLPPPVRYFSEAYFADGSWWRQGRCGPIRVWDELDTSRMYYAKRDVCCDACVELVAHTQRYHLEAVLEGRRRLHLNRDWEHHEVLDEP